MPPRRGATRGWHVSARQHVILFGHFPIGTAEKLTARERVRPHAPALAGNGNRSSIGTGAVAVAQVDEIAPDVFRISIYAPYAGITFNHFLVRDDQPLLFHAGLRGMFTEVREAIGRLIDPASIRHVSFSHFESDECGALNQWLETAPRCEPVCGHVGALVNIYDFAIRPAHVLDRSDVLATGRHRFRLLPTPHLPHGWDAVLLFEENDHTLFCSDLFVQPGESKALSREGIVERAREALLKSEAGPLAHSMPYTGDTDRELEALARLNPRTLATMHGASYAGDGAQALRDLARAMGEILGPGRREGSV